MVLLTSLMLMGLIAALVYAIVGWVTGGLVSTRRRHVERGAGPRAFRVTGSRLPLRAGPALDMEAAESLEPELVHGAGADVMGSIDGAVAISPPRPALGHEICVRYSGPLKTAQALTAHIGYGRGKWENQADLPMGRVEGVWQTRFRVEGLGDLNVAFHDEANRWDNNGGRNWTWTVIS